MASVYVKHPQGKEMILVKMLVSPDMKGDEVLLSGQDMMNIGIIDKNFPNIACNRSKAEIQEDPEEVEPKSKRTKIEEEEEDVEEPRDTEEEDAEDIYDEEEDEKMEDIGEFEDIRKKC